MLPSSKQYLIKGGVSPAAAAWILLGGFAAGFIGIQVVSRFLHHYIPSHVVDCDHNHEDGTHDHSADHSRNHSVASHSRSRRQSHHIAPGGMNGAASESTPLLPSEGTNGKLAQNGWKHTDSFSGRRPSMLEVQKRVMSFVKDTKSNCDSGGPCFGYSDPCGQECFKHLNLKSPAASSRQTTIFRPDTLHPHSHIDGADTENYRGRSRSSTRAAHAHSRRSSLDRVGETDEEDVEAQHHHHVPENAFMSIGLQTSIAIALHKLPEGFITYATNHANPSLGFSVFMALFVHNITEGFAMALPLFLALKSRSKAMFWASLLGGVSQPAGAGIAAAWFAVAGHEGHKPGTLVYGVMFAITAGIMTSVALQLFVESLSLNHNRNLCIAFGFIGMSIMGASNALTS